MARKAVIVGYRNKRRKWRKAFRNIRLSSHANKTLIYIWAFIPRLLSFSLSPTFSNRNQKSHRFRNSTPNNFLRFLFCAFYSRCLFIFDFFSFLFAISILGFNNRGFFSVLHNLGVHLFFFFLIYFLVSEGLRG